MKKIILILIMLTLTINAGTYNCNVTTVNNQEYYNNVKQELSSAKKSIHIILYLMGHYSYGNSRTNDLKNVLIQKSKQGIKVEVILENSQSYNLETKNILQQNGVKVWIDPSYKTTHSKIIIIDGSKVILGSHNWSDAALNSNNEASMIVESEELAKEYLEYFEKVKRECK